MPIQFTLPYDQENQTANEFTPNCAFYNQTSMTWSTDGCSSVVNNASVSCACDHLTQFTLISRPLSATLGSGQAQLSASEAAKHADLLGIFIIYLIPLALASYLLVMAGIVYRTQMSVVPWAKTIYAVIGLVSAMRCVGLALMYFDNMSSTTTAFDQNALSATTTALLLLPLTMEVALLALLGYRYAVVRRKEGASQMVNGKIDLRRASVYTGPASLMPQLDEPSARGRRQSVMQRLSIVGNSETPITEPPSYVAPAVFAGVFTTATVSALIAYLVLEKQTESSSTFNAVSALLALNFLAAFVIIAVWVSFLYKSVPNLKAVMRRGQTLGWIAVFAFFLQSILGLSFAEQRTGSWYFAQSGGVHVMTAIYAIVEIFTLCGIALWWRWTLQWWRTNQVKNLVSRYDTNEANGLRGAKDKDVWNGTLAVPGEKTGDTNSAQRDRLDAQKLGAHRPSIAESMIFSASEVGDGAYTMDQLANTTALDKTEPVVTSIESGIETGKAKDVKKYTSEEKTNDSEQVFSPESNIRSLPTFTSVSGPTISPTSIQLQAVTASLLTARPTTVWSNANSVAGTPSQFAVVDGPMTTPLQLGNRQNPSSSVTASPLVMADDNSLNPSEASSLLPSAAATPLVMPDTSRTLLQSQPSLTNWELTPVASASTTGAANESVPASPRINPAAPNNLPSPVGPMTALSMLSAASTASAASTTVPALESLPPLPTTDDLATSTDSTVQPSPASLSAPSRPLTPPTPSAAAPLSPAAAASTASSAQPSRPISPPIAQQAAVTPSVIATPGGLMTADGRSIQLNITIQANDLQRLAGGKKKVKRSVSRQADNDEPLSPFAVQASDDSNEHNEAMQQQSERQGEPSPSLSPMERSPRVERAEEPSEPASPMQLPSAAAASAGVSRHGHIIHAGKHAKLTREPIVHPDGTFELSAPLASASSSSVPSPTLSPAFKPSMPIDAVPQARSRGRVSRSSVSAIPSEEMKMSPSLAAASAVYQPQRRPSMPSLTPDAHRGSVVRSGSPARGTAQLLQPREVTLRQRSPSLSASQSPSHAHDNCRTHRCKSCSMTPAQMEAAGLVPNLDLAPRTFRSRSNSASSASRGDSEVEDDDDHSSRDTLNPPARLSRPQSPSLDSPAANSAQAQSVPQSHGRLTHSGARITRAGSSSATPQQGPQNNNFFN